MCAGQIVTRLGLAFVKMAVYAHWYMFQNQCVFRVGNV